ADRNARRAVSLGRLKPQPVFPAIRETPGELEAYSGTVCSTMGTSIAVACLNPPSASLRVANRIKTESSRDQLVSARPLRVLVVEDMLDVAEALGVQLRA